MESLDHLFIQCPFVQHVWFSTHWNFRLSSFSNLTITNWLALIFDYTNQLFLSSLIRTEFIAFIAVLFDLLWFHRNKISHGSSSISVQDLAIQVTRQAKAHWDSISLSIIVRSSPNQIWKPPPPGWLKINTDSSFVNGNAFSGCVMRNNNGSIVLATTHVHNCLDVIIAESLALLEACKVLHHYKIKHAILEADSLNAIAFIHGASGSSFWSASPVIDEIRKF